MRKQTLSLFISMVLAGGVALAPMAFAQDDGGGDDPAPSTVPADRLAERHGEGSEEAIAGLRAGGDFTVDGIAVTNGNEAMGYGEIDIALSIANALVESGAYADLASALNGDILAMRADGMGWGEIAQALDLNLGALMSAGRGGAGLATGEDNADGEAGAGLEAAAAGRANGSVGLDRAAEARAGASLNAGAGADARPALPERPATPERPTVPERPALPERPSVPDRPELPTRPSRGGG